MPRPTVFTAEIATELCSRLAACGSLRRVCASDDMPTDDRVRLWVAANEEFARAYARAKSAGIDALVEEALDIADDGVNDWQEKTHGQAFNSENVQRSKLRVEYRRWLAERMEPKKYGVRSEVDLKSTDGSMSPPADEGTRAARAAQLLALAKHRQEQQADSFDDLA
jgi:hypothetical protein